MFPQSFKVKREVQVQIGLNNLKKKELKANFVMMPALPSRKTARIDVSWVGVVLYGGLV